MARWIDSMDVLDGNPQVGQIGFLVRREPQGRATHYEVTSNPARTNLSREPRLTGWCGETNNVSIYAQGMARVARVTRNGRALVVEPSSEEAKAALERLGWPDLD